VTDYLAATEKKLSRRRFFAETRFEASSFSPTVIVSDTNELLSRAARGDRHARAELMDRHRDRLRRMVAIRLDRRLLSRFDPSDVVQETLAEAAQKLSDYVRERPVPFYPWLRRMAWENLVRLHEQHLKAGRRSVIREERSLTGLPDESVVQLADCLAASVPGPDRRVIAAEIKTRVLNALAELTELDREILVLRYLEQLSGREIAAILQINEAAARQRHARALERLTRKVEGLHDSKN
jgi:RNA polymerase sigma-70 factor (ECF subfamily)